MAGPALASCGIIGGAGRDEGGIQRLLGHPEKRVFSAPKTPLPVESRRQRTPKLGDNCVSLDFIELSAETAVPPIISLPLELTDRPGATQSIVHSTQSIAIVDPVKTVQQSQWSKHQIIDSPCGFFRQILSEDEVIYDMPNSHKTSPESLPVEEAVYAEPSMHSRCSTITSFGEKRPKFGVFQSSDELCDSTSHYADPFEHYDSLLEHEYEEMDNDIEYHPHSLPFSRPIHSKGNVESGVSVSSSSDSSQSSRPGGYFSSDSGASLSIPPGLARSRAALFESIAQANQRVIRPNGTKKLVQALGPQLALYSLSSLPSTKVNQSTTSRSCPPSLNAINWSIEACAENDGFFMEFANQRMAIPDSASPSSCSSLQSSGGTSSAETEMTDRSKSSRKVSFVLGPSPSRLVYQDFTTTGHQQTLTFSKGKSSLSTSSSSTALNLTRFFKQTFGRCAGGDGQPSDTESLISHPHDDLLSQSDLEMFCKASIDKRERNDSGTDVTTPDASLYDANLTNDIDAALAILEVKAKTRPTDKGLDVGLHTYTSVDESDLDSTSCSSESSCKSTCSLTDCSSWNDCCWTSESLTSFDVRISKEELTVFQTASHFPKWPFRSCRQWINHVSFSSTG